MGETPEKSTYRGRSRVTPTNTIQNDQVSQEKHLPNGDLYIGTFSNNIPEGVGKYLWFDGCMYEGEWKKGKANGKGKLSWPSGATYEGEFKAGKMEGQGTFTGAAGDTYKGSWVCGKKHGHGEKWYENGDYYVGGWKKGLQDGYGKYVWRNGGYYQGEWKNGVVLRKGVLGRVNGGRFDGLWDNYDFKTMSIVEDSNPSVNGGKFDGALNNCDFKTTSNVGDSSPRGFQRICVWESEGENGDITCDFVDSVDGVSVVYGDGVLGLDQKLGRNLCSFGKEGKKPGQIICKGHKNYDLMLSLQLGIRYSVGKYSSVSRELKSNDFDPYVKFWTRFPPEGSKSTPRHNSTEFRWKDYCPVVFTHLRNLFQVDPAEYMSAICGDDSLRELSSPGKSGSFFYLAQEDKFMIKTVKKSEVKVLLRMLPSYYQHVYRYENSLLTKFYGVHCVKPTGGQKTRFIVMGNLFCSEYRIHRRFDLKGSRHGRTIEKTEGEIDETTTLKDLDLDFVFRLQKNWHQELINQVERDCEFLEAERIMDYSLLVGIHFRNDNTGDKLRLLPSFLRDNKASYENEKYLHGFLETESQHIDRVLDDRRSSISLGANVLGRAERLARSDFDQYISGGNDNLTPSRNSEIYEVILYLGIIDILQDYDMTKWLEHAYKSLQADPTLISSVDPKLYSKRFRDFIGKIFVEDK